MQSSRFKEWQKSCKEISLEDFERRYPNAAKSLKSIEKVFIYQDGSWIAQCELMSNVSCFYCYIEHFYRFSDYFDIAEMRLFLWNYRDNE